MMLFTNLHFSSITQRSCMKKTNCSSCWCIILVFASHQRFCVVKNMCVRFKNQAGSTRGTSYTGLLGTGARGDEWTHAKFFCNQAQNYKCKPLANMTINLILSFIMVVVFSVFWLLCKQAIKFRQGHQKHRSPVSVFIPPDSISLRSSETIGLSSRSTDIWILPIYQYWPKRTILSASVGVAKTLLYSLCV